MTEKSPLDHICEFIERLPPKEKQFVCELIINTVRPEDLGKGWDYRGHRL